MNSLLLCEYIPFSGWFWFWYLLSTQNKGKGSTGFSRGNGVVIAGSCRKVPSVVCFRGTLSSSLTSNCTVSLLIALSEESSEREEVVKGLILNAVRAPGSKVTGIAL